MNRNNLALRLLAGLVLVLAVAGIAYFAYQAGIAQGSPVTIQAPAGESVPAPYPYYGWGGPYHRPFGFGFGFFGFLLMLFLFFVALRAFRFLLWGPRWGWAHHSGPWGRHWENGVPPMFEEWHKRAHNERAEEKKSSDV